MQVARYWQQLTIPAFMYSIFTVVVAERIDAIEYEHIVHNDMYSQDIDLHLGFSFLC